MELQDFITNFASQFDETDVSAFNEDTNYRQLEEWSSLIALSVIAMIDDEYGIKIKGDDIRSVSTIRELYTLVQSR